MSRSPKLLGNDKLVALSISSSLVAFKAVTDTTLPGLIIRSLMPARYKPYSLLDIPDDCITHVPSFLSMVSGLGKFLASLHFVA